MIMNSILQQNRFLSKIIEIAWNLLKFQQIELTNHRTDLAALELMKKDYDKLKGEFEYQKSKLDELQRANDDKDDRIRDLQVSYFF